MGIPSIEGDLWVGRVACRFDGGSGRALACIGKSDAQDFILIVLAIGLHAYIRLDRQHVIDNLKEEQP
jgi:hypothetical protein